MQNAHHRNENVFDTTTKCTTNIVAIPEQSRKNKWHMRKGNLIIHKEVIVMTPRLDI